MRRPQCLVGDEQEHDRALAEQAVDGVQQPRQSLAGAFSWRQWLQEPLLLRDNPVRIMLAGKREERYSDWLALALSTISDATTVLEILGESPDVQGKVSAVREFYMPEGHPERSGRLDIRLFVKESPLVDIEIKLGRAEHSDTGKQEGYSKWGAKKRILVALCGDKPKYEGDFRLLRWRDLCLRLRGHASHLVRVVGEDRSASLIKASLLLCFAGAAEENLLGLNAARISEAAEGASVSLNGQETKYLRDWIRECKTTS